MSTYWYFECLDHSPVLQSVDEFTQHTDDGAYRAAVALAGQRPVEAADYSTGTGYFEGNARSFLVQHPTCHLGLVSEYGEHRALSQPTPTAEPVLPVRAVAAVMDTYDNGDGECEPEDRWRLFRDMRSLLAAEQVAAPALTEPPRIEDMAPGTTFLSTVDQHNTTALRFMRTSTGGAVDQDGTRWPLNAFDPSTIRDVTPPAGA